MTLLAELTAHQNQVRVTSAEAQDAIDRVTGLTATAAITRLRFGPGRTCEQLARVVETAVARAERGGVEAARLVVVGGHATAGEDIVRVRRKFHGKADWIASPTADVVIELQPAGIVASASARVAPAGPSDIASADAPPTPQDEEFCAAIRERLFDVIDPDLGVNIVDLGFYRRARIEGSTAVITMTLTSAACPVTDVMADQIATELTTGAAPAVADFRIEWEWIPSWSPADITDDGREQLRAIGFTL